MAISGEYSYCPYCGTRLERLEVFNQMRPVCTECSFIQFYDPKVAVIAFVTLQGQIAVDSSGG